MAVDIGRRRFISALGGTAVAWPLSARAQQPGMRRVAVLIAYLQGDQEGQARFAAFVDTLQRLGWSDGRNLRLDVQWVGGDIAGFKAVATELIARSPPDVIVMNGALPLAALLPLTKTIPIVFVQVSDPVGGGFVSNLAHPGGNVTGFENFEPTMGGKWLEVLKEAVPSLTRAAVLLGPEIKSYAEFLHTIEALAPTLGVQAVPIAAHDATEIERGIAAVAAQPDGGLIVVPQPVYVQNRDLIIASAARYRLPAIYPFRYFATSGGLIAYGVHQIEQWRGAAGYVDRILKGEKPADLPVQAPTKFELVINLKTAKALGLDIPPKVLALADEVIE